MLSDHKEKWKLMSIINNVYSTDVWRSEKRNRHEYSILIYMHTCTFLRLSYYSPSIRPSSFSCDLSFSLLPCHHLMLIVNFHLCFLCSLFFLFLTLSPNPSFQFAIHMWPVTDILSTFSHCMNSMPISDLSLLPCVCFFI